LNGGGLSATGFALNCGGYFQSRHLPLVGSNGTALFQSDSTPHRLLDGAI